jgi:TolB-like protein/class 3 adenylate cyclase/Tfp pilus assembly protein PilF
MKKMAVEPQEHRKLAAIMFTDMVGYSALTQRSETLALELLKEHRELLRPMFPRHGGKEVETKGDAFFVEFASTLEAARCAIAIQQALFERNGKAPLEKQIRLRIGLHVGDVVHTGKYVHGDGVNIAARLEPLATPGGICLSEDVARQIQNKTDLPLRKLGRGELKNIQLPVEIYKIVLPWEKRRLALFDRLYFRFKQKRAHRWSWAIGIVVSIALLIGLFFRFFAPSEKLPMSDSRPKIRLAVLPFDNITKNPEDEYFADGMTDEMIAKLSNIASFGVIARTSVMQYKTNPKSIAEVGRELRVSKVLEGSVRKSPDKLLIRVQLIDVKTEEPVWIHDYDRAVRDVFAIQSEVAQQVASALRVGLSPEEKRELERRGTENLEAYSLYLQGNYYAEKRTPQALHQGIEYFNEAIKLDPEFAYAYSGLAKSYNLTVIYGYLPPNELFPKAKAAAMRALEISEMLGEAHSELARIMYWHDWDWQGSEREFRRAIELAPGYPRGHQGYAEFLSHRGRFEEAIDQIRRAQELDPLYLISHLNEGEIFYYARRFDQAIQKLNKLVEMEPNFFIPYLYLGLSYLEKGMLEEALAATQKCVTLSGGFTAAIAAQAYIFAKSGRRSEAQTILDQLLEVSRQRYVPPSLIAFIYTGLGEKEKAFKWFQKAYEIRDPYLVYHIVAPYYDSIRSDQRFSALLKKMGLEK